MATSQQALAAYVKLVRAADSITACAHAHLSEHSLTMSQFGVLEALLHKGPMCQKALAGKLLKSGGNITTVVDNLEKRALVRRERGQDDRRYSTVHLTEAGRALIEAVFPVHAEGIAALFTVLDDAELARLGELCRKLGRACSA